jgi:hypothetical protein
MCRTSTGSEAKGLPEQGPGDEREGYTNTDDHEQQIATVSHPPAAGIHSHSGTVGARYRTAGVSMRMLFARATRAARARSQSGSSVRRTSELWASHLAVHDVQVSR